MEFEKEVIQQLLIGERVLFGTDNVRVVDSVFDAGESPLKECNNIEIIKSVFKWKYPLWYCNNVLAEKTNLLDTARAGIWYSNNVKVSNCIIEAPKTFRRCDTLEISNTYIPRADETLWNCKNIKLNNVQAKGDYFGMNSSDGEIENLSLDGNYPFDGAKYLLVKNSRLLSKDAFWNTDNVIVQDSFILGEYLGWNSKNLTFVNCVIESLQGLCYIQNLVMKNCRLINTTLAFEYSTVDAQIEGDIDSVLNPSGGTIKAERIKELILEHDKIDPSQTTIIVKG